MFAIGFMHTLRNRIQALIAASFVRSVGVLVGGTAFAQGLTVLALPLVTRLYTPADFSALAVYASALSILSVAACLRLEIAIPMPDSDEDAANLLAIALCSCSAVAALTGVVVWLYPAEIVALVGQPDLRPFLYLLPLGIWITSSYTAVQFWSTRQKRFGAIATTRVAQAIGGTGTQLGLGWMSFNPSGLLLGHLVTSGMGLVGLSRETLRKDCASLRTISWPGMCRMLRQYDRFPKFSTFEAFANSAGTQLPVIIIAAWVVGPEAGYLMLAARVMAAPMGLIGGAVAQVYLSQAPQEHRAGRLDSFTCQVIGGLAKSGIGPLIFVGILAPVVFPLVFGQNWGRAGALLAWMTPWFIMQFLVAPVSMALHIAGKQQIALGLQLFGLVLRVGMVVGAGWFTYSSIGEVYAISGFFFYCLYLYVVTLLLGIKPSQLFRAVSSGFLIISLWAVVGIGAAIALRTIASVSP